MQFRRPLRSPLALSSRKPDPHPTHVFVSRTMEEELDDEPIGRSLPFKSFFDAVVNADICVKATVGPWPLSTSRPLGMTTPVAEATTGLALSFGLVTGFGCEDFVLSSQWQHKRRLGPQARVLETTTISVLSLPSRAFCSLSSQTLQQTHCAQNHLPLGTSSMTGCRHPK